MNKCPCDLCVTRAICLCKTYEVMMECVLVREFLNAESGNITVPELREFCKSMNLRLIESHRSSIGTTTYFVKQRNY
jgi:hypothetical protein